MPTIAGLAEIGPWGLVTLFAVAVGLGWLIPRWTHNERIADYKEQNKLLREALKTRDDQFSQALQNNALVVQALEGIRREAARS